MEKFMNIKCRAAKTIPSCIVLVCTVRALKMHGGGPDVVAGTPLDKLYTQENVDLVEKGCDNLVHHIKTAKQYGIPVVVAINAFPTDTQKEYDTVIRKSKEAGAFDAVVSLHHALGGVGAKALGESVISACSAQNSKPENFKFLYELQGTSIKDKIEAVAMKTYGASKVEYTEQAEQQIGRSAFCDC
jgi:formyltetrahydrofolate synthetase